MNIKTIHAKELVDNHDLETLCLLDVRSPAEVRNDALTSIIAMPLDQLDPDTLADIIKQQHQDAEHVYLICQSGKRAQMAAEKLAGKLSQDLVVVEGGMSAIREAQGGNVSHGSVMSIERQVRLTAGSLVLIGVLAGYLLNANWFALSGVVGAGLIYAAITDNCMMGLLMAKAPWNR